MTPFEIALMDLTILAYTTASTGFIVFSMLFCIFVKEKDYDEN